MAIETTDRKVQYTLSGTIPATFAIPFPAWYADEISVILVDTEGNTVLLEADTDYTITNSDAVPNATELNGEDSTLVRVGAWEEGVLTIFRTTERTQSAVLANGGVINATVLTKIVDRLTAMVQELAEDISRASTTPITGEGSLTISNFWQTVLDDLSASDSLTSLGLSTFIKTLVDDATKEEAQETLGLKYYDLVIDSNDKLDQWCQADEGQYPRVLIKSGTWTSSIASPTANIYINMDASGSGTKIIDAEPGSSIVFNPAVASPIGIKSTSSPVVSNMRIKGLNLVIVCGGTGNPVGASGLCNVENMTITMSGSGGATGFQNSYYLSKCSVTITNSSANDHIGYSGGKAHDSCSATISGSTGNNRAWQSAQYLSKCTADVTGAIIRGMESCYDVTNCRVTCTQTSTGAACYAIGNNFRLIGCIGAVAGNGTNDCHAFINNISVVLCEGSATNSSSGAGYGFKGCKKMQQNRGNPASKSANYDTSYSDAGTANACADTAAGGYNS
jgi:hypothetical protein